jgi:hypothetical protein
MGWEDGQGGQGKLVGFSSAVEDRIGRVSGPSYYFAYTK